MSFRTIKGSYHLDAGQPDGDSVRFLADDPGHFIGLKGHKVKFKQDGTTETPPGYTLARQVDVNSRPVSFAFRGNPGGADGATVFLKPALLRKSANFHIVKEGYAYPMFYETNFAELRATILEALTDAKKNKRGYWPKDGSRKGVKVATKADAKTIPPIFPKLWRRLFSDYKGNLADLSAFKAWLDTQDERLFTLSDGRFLSFADVVAVKGQKVRLTYDPEDFVFRPA